MSKRILIIEDNKDVRENTSEILELAGYEVVAAENGKVGVDLAVKESPDLIICDIMMPELDGYGVLHMLGKNNSTEHIPFIFLTAKTERQDFRKGMEMGADDFITKPFDDVELLNAIESRLKKAEVIRRDVAPTRDGVNALLKSAKGIEDISSFSSRQQVKSYRKKDRIFTEGDTAVGLYLITRGKAKTFKSHELGKDLITKLLQPGDFFGYHALLEEKVHAETAEALDDCEVVVFPKEDFLELIYNSPNVMRQFISLLSGNIIEEQERLLSLAYSSVRKRTATALVKLDELYHNDPSRPFSMAVAREDLANLVGTATESLIRTLSDFKAEGLISIQGSTITISDLAKLKRMKN